MNLITVKNLTKQMGGRLLFQDVDLMINEGDRIGLIGVNGSGKSTLLRILAGLEASDAGTVTVWGGVRVGYLPQEPTLEEGQTVLETVLTSDTPQMQLMRRYELASTALQERPRDSELQAELVALSADMERTGAWAAEADAKAVLTRLDISQYDAPIGRLSGGHRKRVALARALIDRADVLILDEPTNHIDAETVSWLEETLAIAPGALLMVTHDRYFLDRVVNRIVELDRRQLISYPGNYSHYLEQRVSREERLTQQEHKRSKLLRRELDWLRRSPMARGTKQKARKQRVDELLQMRQDGDDDVVSIAMAGSRLGKQALDARGLNKQFGGRTVVDDVSLRLEPGERIGILGPNGAGKTTLLDMLTGKVDPDSGRVRWGETVRVGYYDQGSEDLDDHRRVIEFVEEEAPVILTRDGSYVEAAKMLEWFLFPRSVQWAQIGSLSGGERRRLYLLRTLIHQPNVLILDEPTNDLDIQTLGVLEEFLDRFSGCLIVVSHDRYFLDRSVDYLCYMRDGRLGPRYPTPYTTFLHLWREAESGQGEQQLRSTNRAARSGKTSTRRTNRLAWSDQRELEALEKRVGELEDERSQLVEDMAGCGDDYISLQDLAGRLATVDAELSIALDRWVELSEVAEDS